MHPPAQAQLPDKETSRRTRIFGEDVDAQGSAPARGPSSSTITSRTERTRVYGVDDDDRYGGDRYYSSPTPLIYSFSSPSLLLLLF